MLDDVLIFQAIEAAKNAHCPYSKFHVGAAVLDTYGDIWTGCNVENASYGLTICAERVALVKCVSHGRKPMKIAVACPDLDSDALLQLRMPCGACRQFMAEFLTPSDEIIVVNGGVFSMEQLLPAAFSLSEPKPETKVDRTPVRLHLGFDARAGLYVFKNDSEHLAIEFPKDWAQASAKLGDLVKLWQGEEQTLPRQVWLDIVAECERLDPER